MASHHPHSAPVASREVLDFQAERAADPTKQILGPGHDYHSVTEKISDLPHPIPMTIDYTSGVYCHTESGGVLVGMADKSEPPGFNETVDYSFIEKMAEQAMHRIPRLETAAIKTQWAGLYEVTPDHHPVLGPAGEPGWWVACGFSGHGVMHAPATGQLMSELLLSGRPALDVSCLRLSRFKEGKPMSETNVI